MADTMKRPTERAMKAAVEMEVHAACSTSTLGKGLALDQAFPGYDELLVALKAAKEVVDVAESMTSCRGDDDFIWSAQKLINEAIAKAEGGAA